MMVDFFVINVLVQGLNLGKHIRRRLIAPYKLTQFEMNEAYSVKADLYVVDRLQILTKFAVLALMYSAALPVRRRRPPVTPPVTPPVAPRAWQPTPNLNPNSKPQTPIQTLAPTSP